MTPIQTAPTPAEPAHQNTTRKPLRLWPGLVLVAAQLLLMFALPAVRPSALIVGMLGGVVCMLAIYVWWAFFSRVPQRERWGALLLAAVAIFALRPVLHESIAGAGMGMFFPIYALISVSVALVAAAAIGRRLPAWPRRAVLAAAVLVALVPWTLLRTGGITGTAKSDFAWRWSQTPEERLLAQGDAATAAGQATAPVAVDGSAEWPGFRGPERDGVARGVRISADWSTSPPVELWRRPVGPGWSSFAVSGGRVYTQEQRGGEEVVACYQLSTGRPLWAHKDAARFYESNGGAGPRGTPTLSGGRVYALGATGILNALDAADGRVLWSRNAASDTQTKVPGWGFSASPLVVGDKVVVALTGNLAAYDAATGEPRWTGPKGGGSYSSPHLVKIGGVEQVVLLCATGAVSVAPEDGRVLWQYPMTSSARIVQPGVTPEGDLLVGEGEGSDMHRIAVSYASNAWAVEERWTTDGLKPYFNDLVVHEGHAYGFDAGKLACIDLGDGARRWSGGEYGAGQLVLVPDQDLLVVVSEEGELALVSATPGGFRELARRPAIKGKTWNHPVLAGDVLLVRNAEEMAAFKLPR